MTLGQRAIKTTKVKIYQNTQQKDWGYDRRPRMIKHLQEQNMSYIEHWSHAMKMCGALFIHAWIPSVFTTYTSKKILDKLEKND